MSPSHTRKAGRPATATTCRAALFQGRSDEAGSSRSCPARPDRDDGGRSASEAPQGAKTAVMTGVLVDQHLEYGSRFSRSGIVLSFSFIGWRWCRPRELASSGPMCRGARSRWHRREILVPSDAQFRHFSPHQVRNASHACRLDRARTPLAQRTRFEHVSLDAGHRKARRMQRAEGQHDNLASLSRAQPRESRD